jgi:alkanesulfonate monooxygenase SsuD/methylene tetrahydromethanopterin reductase-like flavin-dependent oxidoreductase (luciferase family)
MRNPVRSETDAFYIAFGAAVVIGACALLGVLVGLLAGAGLFVVVLAGICVWAFATKDPERRQPLREAARVGRGAADGDRPLILVVANRTLGDQDLRAEMLRHAAAGAELRILAPILVSRARYLASDVDNELRQGRRRLKETLAWAATEGIAATGAVGDPNAALDAIEDELRLRAAEEVIVSTLPAGESNWLETGIVGRLKDELEIPVTHIVASSRTPSHSL